MWRRSETCARRGTVCLNCATTCELAHAELQSLIGLLGGRLPGHTAMKLPYVGAGPRV